MAPVLPSPRQFLERGFLPENLPPVFSSIQLSKCFDEGDAKYSIVNAAQGEHAIYNASKRGGQRRIFGIPHPAFVWDQALFFNKHWNEVLERINKSTGSVSKPEPLETGTRYVRITPHSDLPKIRLRTLSRYRFCLVADVSRFYSSIYTHSVPWALHGKKASKNDHSNKSEAIFGNRLDFILRQSQLQQTVGIPVGPDTSKLVSELLMAAVDGEFISRSGKVRPAFVRHVDDYWIAGNTHEECQKHLQNLRTALRTYELDINEAKTKIVTTNLVIAEDWPFEFDRDISEVFQAASDVENAGLAVLSRVIDRANTSSDDGIVRHAIRRLDESRAWANGWDFLEHFLAQCAVQFPHSLDYVARVVVWRNRTEADVDKDLWLGVASQMVKHSASLGRDSEAVWSMWLIKELGGRIDKATSDAMLENCNGLTLAFLSHFAQHNRVSDRRLFDALKSVVSDRPFSGVWWPLSLELTHLNKSDPNWANDGIPNCLLSLHKERSTMLNWNAKPRVFADEVGGVHDGTTQDLKPEFALEDLGSDYGDDSEESEDDDPEVVSAPL